MDRGGGEGRCGGDRGGDKSGENSRRVCESANERWC